MKVHKAELEGQMRYLHKNYINSSLKLKAMRVEEMLFPVSSMFLYVLLTVNLIFVRYTWRKNIYYTYTLKVLQTLWT